MSKDNYNESVITDIFLREMKRPKMPAKAKNTPEFQVDMLGQEVRVGDTVVAILQAYRELEFYKVVSLTPKGIKAIGIRKLQRWRENEIEQKVAGSFIKVDADQANAVILIEVLKK